MLTVLHVITTFGKATTWWGILVLQMLYVKMIWYHMLFWLILAGLFIIPSSRTVCI
jgi:hypothetical protein